MEVIYEQPQDQQDQTANSEQVGQCSLEKGQFILVNRWPFKLDIECFRGAEVYQCPCPVGSELIPFDTVVVVSRVKSQKYLNTPATPPFGEAKSLLYKEKVNKVQQSSHSL